MGERQRVMIARALSTQPSLLLADEPTGSLDTQRSREVLELLRELCRERNVAIVLVSHDPLAAGYADRVFALRDGRLSDYQPEQPSRRSCRRAQPVAARYGQREAANLLHLYRVRVRARAGAGAVRGRRDRRRCGAAVRLPGGEPEPQSSVAQLSHGIVGNATLQLLARDPHGMPEAARRSATDPRRSRRRAAAGSERRGERPAGQRIGGAGRRRLQPPRSAARSCATPTWNRSRVSARSCSRHRSPHDSASNKFGREVDAAGVWPQRASAAVRAAPRTQIGGLAASPIAWRRCSSRRK